MLSILVSDIWRTLASGAGEEEGEGVPEPLLVLGGRRGSGHWEEKKEGRGEPAFEDSTTKDFQLGTGLERIPTPSA